MENDYFFEPYKGNWYDDPTKNIFGGKRVLVVGHNHNCIEEREPKTSETICRKNCLAQSEKCSKKTWDIIDWYKSYKVNGGERPRSSNTFTKFGNFLTNYEENFTILEAYESIAFYNYCQYAVPDWNAQPIETQELNQYKDSERAFLNVLEEFSPDIVIVWSVDKVFNKLPNCYADSKILLTDFKRKFGLKKYNINSKEIIIIGIQHPMAFCPSKWHDIIFPKFMQLRK